MDMDFLLPLWLENPLPQILCLLLSFLFPCALFHFPPSKCVTVKQMTKSLGGDPCSPPPTPPFAPTMWAPMHFHRIPIAVIDLSGSKCTES